MSQSPLGLSSVNPAGALKPNKQDAPGLLMISDGGLSWAQVTAAVIVKATPGRVAKLTVITAGSAGSLVLEDAATVGAEGSAATFFSAAFGALTVGTVVNLNWPCLAGIAVQSVPTGAVFALSYT